MRISSINNNYVELNRLCGIMVVTISQVLLNSLILHK